MTTAHPLILLHGALGSAEHFDPLLTEWTPSTRALTLDFPGHGGQPANGPFSIAAFADAVERVMDQHQVAAADFFGYSMGGYVALYLAWKKPGRVRRVFTLGTKFAWSPETSAREVARLDPEAMEAKIPAFARQLARRHAPEHWKDVVINTAQFLTRLGAHPELTDETWAAINCPVTIGLGELDTMVTPEESRAVANALPQGRFEILPGTKHPLEQVDAGLLAEYLRNCLVVGSELPETQHPEPGTKKTFLTPVTTSSEPLS